MNAPTSNKMLIFWKLVYDMPTEEALRLPDDELAPAAETITAAERWELRVWLGKRREDARRTRRPSPDWVRH